MALGSRVFL